ncbi:MAG: MucR family transcriptional regulator [Blastomonas fulva]|jgi:predicted transcriptional regulator|uniref:MucR family transcriptional regulator n=1 Tax=Alphaproteobacteria TaxID=28211 RepID=UPI0024E1E40B|nr:MucR family transcriptional regulator [Blastomonas fulva]MDK2759301.1 MucR family transcriptional regulator [Blastomonas fulva]
MENPDTLAALTADIVIAHISNNKLAQAELPQLISAVHKALSSVGKRVVTEQKVIEKPAVSVRASVKPDYLVCLEDGKKMTMLKRHLMVHYGLTPADYRKKWNLPKDYPMVSPNYAKRRSELAVQIGLGRGGRGGQPAPAVPAAET